MKARLYPPTIRVGKSTYKLKLVEYISETKKRETRGLHDPDEKTISLLSTMDEKLMFETFLHELLHAIEVEHGITLKHKLIYALEAPLADAIRRNFHLVPKR